MKDFILRKLTDAYNKNPYSNMGKLIGVLVSEFEELQGVFEKIESWRSIDRAQGQALDDFGVDINQYRGTANDEIYRILLKSKTARDLSTGDTNTIIDVLSMAIDADKSDIVIEETWMDEDNPEPSGISLIEIPYERLNEVGMSGKQFVNFVAATVAAGVVVRGIDLQGTFEYGGDELEHDFGAGFSNVDNQGYNFNYFISSTQTIKNSIGGYYGDLYDSETSKELPM